MQPDKALAQDVPQNVGVGGFSPDGSRLISTFGYDDGHGNSENEVEVLERRHRSCSAYHSCGI